MGKILLLLSCLASVGCACDIQISVQKEKSMPFAESQRHIWERLRALAKLLVLWSPTQSLKPFGSGFCIPSNSLMDTASKKKASNNLNRISSDTVVMLHVTDQTRENGEQEQDTNAKTKDLLLETLPVPSSAADAEHLMKLQKRSRKGDWCEAMRILEMMEVSPDGAPPRAYHLALRALSKKGKRLLVEQVVERMGDRVDTEAYNELLHVLGQQNDYDALIRVWGQMDRNDPQRAPNVFSYQKLLRLCGSQGRWKKSMALLEELEHVFGVGAMHAGHWLAVIRACIADHRWDEAVSVARKVPVNVLESNVLLCERALVACAEAGDPDLAACLVRILCSKPSRSEKACLEYHTQSLLACRRCKCINSTRAAWQMLENAACTPDGLTFAVMVGALFDVAAAQVEHAAECAQEALDLLKRAFDELPPSASRVVLNSALASVVGYEMIAPAREILRLLEVVNPDLLTVVLQLRVLEICANTADWDAFISEVGLARQRIKPAWSAEIKDTKGGFEDTYIMQMMREVTRSSGAGVDEAFAALAALESFGDDLASLAEDLDLIGNVSASTSSDAATKSFKLAQRQFSKTITIAPDYSEPLDVLYEDDDLLAVSKPEGISAHPVHRTEAISMLNRAVAHVGGGTPHVLHRLDQGTSGVLLFAKNVIAAREVAKQFRDRKIEKAYVALLSGIPEMESFECALHIASHPLRGDLSAVVQPDELGSAEFYDGRRGLKNLHSADSNGNRARSALTRFEVLAKGTSATACLVRPVTGRMHQIRVHAEALGHPLAGDEQYGLDMQTSELNCSRLMLHAYELCVTHPTQKERMCFKAPLPETFVKSATLLGVPAKALQML